MTWFGWHDLFQFYGIIEDDKFLPLEMLTFFSNPDNIQAHDY